MDAEGGSEPADAEPLPTDDDGEASHSDANQGEPPLGDAGMEPPLPESWEQMPGTARDVAVGANGDLWIVGTSEERFGHSVHKWVGGEWVRVATSGAERISVDPSGAPWIVSNTGSTMRRASNGTGDAAWLQLPGCAIDIGVGDSGDVWSVQCDNAVYKWDGLAWLPSGFTTFRAGRVAVGPDGTPWVVALGERVFRRTSPLANAGGWEYLHGTGARDIAVAPEGGAFIVSDVAEDGGFIVKLLNEHGAWVHLEGSAGSHNLAVGTRALWIVDGALQIRRRARAYEHSQ